MKPTRLFVSAILALSAVPFLASAQPVVSNVTFDQQPVGTGSTQVVVNYDLASPDGPTTTTLLYSLDTAVFVPALSVSGHVGPGQTTGTLQMNWAVANDLPDVESNNLVVRVLAEDGIAIPLSITSDAPADIHQMETQTLTFAFAEPVTGFNADDITVTGGTMGAFEGSGAVYTLEVTGIGGTVSASVMDDAASSIASGTTTLGSSFTNFFQDTWTLELQESPLVTMDLIRIPAGSFTMGAPLDEVGRFGDEVPHEVNLSQDFYLGKTEVTQEQWLALAGDFPTGIQAHGTGPGSETRALHNVSFDNIMDPTSGFMKLVNDHLAGTNQGLGMLTLPTEAQWEYAARAGTTTRFSFGDGLDPDGNDNCTVTAQRSDNMWYCGNAESSTQLVAQKLPNPWGLYDMHGNVAEWTAAAYGPYPTGPVTDPLGDETATNRVARGGAFNNFARFCRAAVRRNSLPTNQLNNIGFRVASARPLGLTITSTLPEGSSSQTQNQTLTFTFAEPVTGFDASSVTVSNATVGTFTAVSSSVYTLELNADANGTVSASVGANAAQVPHPYISVQQVTFSNNYDTLSPTVTLASVAPSSVNGPITVTTTLSDVSENFVAGNISSTNSTVSGFSGSGTNYSFTLTPTTEGLFSAVVNEDVFTDIAGNSNIASPTFSRIYDVTPPTLSFSSPGPTRVNAPITVTATLSEPSPNFNASVITPTNATISAFTGSGADYSFTLTPTAQGTFSVAVAPSAFTDIAGNFNTAATTFDRTYDISPPNVFLNSPAPTVVPGPITVTATLSEPSTNFTADSLTLTNATVSEFTGSGSIYSFTLTPTNDGTFTVAVGPFAFTDIAGNPFAQLRTLSRTFDSSAPTLSSVIPTIGSTVGSLNSITITFSEPVTGVTAGLLTVNGSPATTLAGTNPYNFSGFATPAEGAVLLIIPSDNSITDLVGNPFPGVSWSYDLYDPVDLTITSTLAEGSVSQTQNQTLTFTFAQPVMGFDTSDVTVTGATKGTFSGSGAVYTLALTGTGGMVTASVAAGAGTPLPPYFTSRSGTFSNFYQDTWTIELQETPLVTMELIRIPAGTFEMGSPEDELSRNPDETQHTVTLTQDFYLGKTPVTGEQWATLDPLSSIEGQRPVSFVTWANASSWLTVLESHVTEPATFSLPTEAQWEYAARAGTTTRFYFGDGLHPDGDEECGTTPERIANMWYCGNNPAPGGVKPVGQKLPNPWGLYDMHGNIYQWCLDFYGPYPTGSVVDPTGPTSGTRVVRGGSWSSDAQQCRSATRREFLVSSSNTISFRVVAVRD